MSRMNLALKEEIIKMKVLKEDEWQQTEPIQASDADNGRLTRQ